MSSPACRCGARPRFVLGPDRDVAQFYRDGPEPGRDDAGIDLVFPRDYQLDPYGVTVVDLRVRARALGPDSEPEAYLLLPRSSIARTPYSLANSIGLIDRGYVGTLKVAIRNDSSRLGRVRQGEALFQLVHPSLRTPSWTVEPDSPLFDPAGTVRGAGGLGSTGATGSAVAANQPTADQPAGPPADAEASEQKDG